MHRVPSSSTVDRILSIHNAVLIIPQLRHVRIIIDVLFKVLVIYFNISTVVLALAVIWCCVGEDTRGHVVVDQWGWDTDQLGEKVGGWRVCQSGFSHVTQSSCTNQNTIAAIDDYWYPRFETTSIIKTAS